jgi:hypothetical protein
MAVDLTTAIVALVSATIGGALTSGGNLLAERSKFKREREAVDSSGQRAFRTEALEQTSRALQALAHAVYHQRIERAVYEAPSAVSKDDVSAVKATIDNIYEAQTEASLWSERIHDVGIRRVSLEAVAALITVHTVEASDRERALDLWTQAEAARYAAQQAIGGALRSFY